ncbi:TetR/AcrR family transcriptional regulator [Weissella soli]|jgi:AcrR family transcriptional regulator|uniref:TetR/AcrR family transcriptional regulator n=1 Tax=Weissella soli TaxID=155866 RepID=UPI003C709D80
MKREEKKALTRQQLIEATLAAIANEEDIELKNIARAAGISVVTLYKYFPSKQALLEQAAIFQFEIIANHVQEIMNQTEIDFPVRMDQFHTFLADYHMRYANSDKNNPIYDIFVNSPILQAEYRTRLADLWQIIIDAGRDAGYINRTISDTALRLYIEMYLSYFHDPDKIALVRSTPKLDEEFDALFFFGLAGTVTRNEADNTLDFFKKPKQS